MQVGWLPMAAALMLLPGLSGQTPEPASAPAETTGQAEFEALSSKFDKEWNSYRKKRLAAYRAGGREAMRALADESPIADFIPKFQSGAARWATKPEAIPFLTWLVTTGGSANSKVASDALATLAVDHGASADLEQAVLALRRTQLSSSEVAEALAIILEVNEDPVVRGAALLVRGMRALDQGASDQAREAAVADLHQGLELAPDLPIADTVEGAIFEAEHLQVGMVAPDIVGQDLDGETFKLSDYRGKVVMLDFWGDW